MRYPGEFIGGGALDGLCWIAGRNHGDVFTALDRQRSRYRWDASRMAWIFAGWLIKDDRPPKRKPISLREHFRDGSIGSEIVFDPDQDGYQDS